MHRSSGIILALAVLATPSIAAVAQNAYIAGAGASRGTQSEAAPIERQAPAGTRNDGTDPQQQRPRIITSQPARGVTVRTDQPGALHTITSSASRTELKLDHGRTNIIVRSPAPDMLLLVDLPNGQTQLLKDGFYTFNADTNTVRVFAGEADAFASSANKPVKVKENERLVFAGSQTRVSYADSFDSRQDVLQGGMYAGSRPPAYGYGPGSGYGPGYGYAAPYYGYGPYSAWDGFYGSPYGYYPNDSYGGPYWGGIGIGFGFGGYGGFGGYRGGYGGYGYRGFGGFGGGGYRGGGRR